MRVLIISNIYPPGFIGGYELGALDVTRGLQSAGHEVCVLTSDFLLDDERALLDLPIARVLDCVDLTRIMVKPLEQVRRGCFVNPRNIRRVGSEIIAFRPDTVLSFNTAGLGTLGLAQFLAGLDMSPVFFLMDDIFRGLHHMPQLRDLARRLFGGMHFIDAAEFIVMSDNLRAQVEESLCHRLRNVTTIPGWPGPLADHDSLRTPVAAPDGLVRFVFTSRIAAHKGIDIALDAACRIVATGRTDFILDVFGAGDTPQLLQRIAALGLAERVHYRGVLSKGEMTRRLAEYDALLFPTWEREAFGFVVPEAASAGCIPVMTGGIGAAEWFFDGIDSLKIQRDAVHLAGAMLQVLLMPKANRLAMRRRCQETGRRFFRFSDALDRIGTVLQRSAANSRLSERTRVRGAEAAMTVLDDMWEASENV
jgi:glycogen synthase